MKLLESVDKHPQVFVDHHGKVDVLDGRHRISETARREGGIVVATPEDVELPAELLAEEG
jgi:hypothetical protein